MSILTFSLLELLPHWRQLVLVLVDSIAGGIKVLLQWATCRFSGCCSRRPVIVWLLESSRKSRWLLLCSKSWGLSVPWSIREPSSTKAWTILRLFLIVVGPVVHFGLGLHRCWTSLGYSKTSKIRWEIWLTNWVTIWFKVILDHVLEIGREVFKIVLKAKLRVLLQEIVQLRDARVKSFSAS